MGAEAPELQTEVRLMSKALAGLLLAALAATGFALVALAPLPDNGSNDPNLIPPGCLGVAE
jgi:hypothetical protein